MQILAGGSIINFKTSGAPVEGAGLVVVFLHGWGRTMDDFDGLAAAVVRGSSGAAVLQLDLPGFGGSSLPRESGFSLDDYCQVLENLLDKLAVSKAALVGHSFGGRVAVRFGAAHPERVKKLVLISAAGIRRKSLGRRMLSFGRRFFRAAFYAVRRFGFAARLKNFLGITFGSPDYRAARGALRETFKKTISEDLRSDASKLLIPTLLIWGRGDKMTPLGDGQTYAQLIAGSRLEILECGHFPFLEKPEESARAIILFLKDA